MILKRGHEKKIKLKGWPAEVFDSNMSSKNMQGVATQGRKCTDPHMPFILDGEQL